MPDWFLRTHGVPGLPLCFDMGGLWSTVSIRDQMLRAHELVRRLARVGALSAARPLLVIGAGAAGATAALEAAWRGIPCRVIDSARSPFGRQAQCHTRWVDPTQYDWPMPHWNTARFPWLRSGAAVTRVSLPWLAAPAAHLAITWSGQLLAACAAGEISIDYETEFINATLLPTTLVEAKTQKAAMPSEKHPYGAIIAATGMGSERTKTNGGYESWAFWDNDTLEAHNCGLTTKPRVLISGAGDGALQDFLRTVTGLHSARKIWNRLVNGTTPPLDTFLELLAAEDQLKCAYACADAADEHDILQEVHDRTHAAARLWYSNNRAVVERMLQDMLRDRPEVLLVHPCSHFGKAYMLNRFLVHIIAEYFESHGRSVLRPEVRVHEVHPRPPHNTCTDPDSCLGHVHEVHLVEQPLCSDRAGTAVIDRLGPNIVVLRHGIDAAPGVFRRGPAGPFKHPLPQYPQP